MTLISPDSTCAICDELLLHRRYIVVPHVRLLYDSHLGRWSGAPVHVECLDGWHQREEVSRMCFVEHLAGCWRDGNTLLAAAPEWFLTGSPGELWSFPDPYEPSWVPGSVRVRLAAWPFDLASSWEDWDAYVACGYRAGMSGSMLDVADAVMAEVRRVASSVDALAALHAARPATLPGTRTLAQFGDFLATLWGEAAYEWDWEAMESDERDDLRAMAERSRRRAEGIAQSNEVSRFLAAELASGGPLRCPHCARWTRNMRFVDSAPHTRTYFVCRLCGGSFAGREAQADE